jgi:CheY-like chemotaxis protein
MKNLELFYVDCDYDDRKSFKAAAEHLGHHVSVFQSPGSLLEALEYAQPDVIFMEMYMPTFNGVEMVNYLRKCEPYRDIPLVMVSCIYPREIVGHLLMAGVNFLLKKPTVPAFECAIERVLEIDLRCPIILN